MRRPLSSMALTCVGVISVTMADPAPLGLHLQVPLSSGQAECLSAAGNPRALRVVGHLTSGWSPAGGIRGWGSWTPCVLRDGHSQGLGESKADVDFGACGAVFRVPPCAAQKQPQLLRCPPDPGASSACGWRVSPCPQPSAPAASVLL